MKTPIERLSDWVWDKYRGKPIKRIGIDYMGGMTILTVNMGAKVFTVTAIGQGKQTTYELGLSWRKRVEIFKAYQPLRRRVIDLLEGSHGH